MSERAGAQICAKFPEVVLDSHQYLGDDTVVINRDGLVSVLTFLRDELGFNLPLDATCVDLLGLAKKPEAKTDPIHPMYHTQTLPTLGKIEDGPRFMVVYHLRRTSDAAVIRLKVPLLDGDPVMPSATSVYKGLTWAEREVYDMFGVRFEGHPDLRRILLYPEFVGHPLRKDYPRRGHQPLVDMPNIKKDLVVEAETNRENEQ
ncbi:MAG TPA: NADH-quinone oxidoreductase subunit C [Myxococcota bacterium]|nr:NADH-quinone oxidoreductase subunit C [Myxococcota bacterium]HPL25062.1 NADH-quinone oxidoreductase subunit C [Myxococcota bacterium]